MSLLQSNLEIWRETMGLPGATPLWVIASLGLAAIYVLVVFPSGALMSFIDRKLSADFQARIGPNRSGPNGILQPLADFLKLLQKQSLQSRSWRESLWLAVHTMALYSTVAVIPFGSSAVMVNTDMSAFLPFWAALVLALGTMLLGFSQESVTGWFGGVRVAGQALAGALPALVCLICAGVHAGGFQWLRLASVQGASPLSWTGFSNPFEFIAFVAFVISGLVLLGVPPMDGGLSTLDLHGGVASDLSGRRLILFRLGRFYGFFLWSVIATVLFLGAWNLPFGIAGALSDGGRHALLEAIELAWLLAKTFTLMTVVVLVSRVNPRGRVDQTTDFAWKVLSPFALVALIGSGIWVGWRAMF